MWIRVFVREGEDSENYMRQVNNDFHCRLDRSWAKLLDSTPGPGRGNFGTCRPQSRISRPDSVRRKRSLVCTKPSPQKKNSRPRPRTDSKRVKNTARPQLRGWNLARTHADFYAALYFLRRIKEICNCASRKLSYQYHTSK